MDVGDHVLWVSARPDLDSWKAFDRRIAELAGDIVSPGGADAIEQVCAASPDTRVILIVDDGDWILDAVLRDRLVDLCRRLPTLHIVGATGDVTPAVEDPRGSGLSFTLVTGRDLLVTDEEARELARAWGLDRSDEEVAAARLASGGWLGLLRELLEDDLPRHDHAVHRFLAALAVTSPEAATVAVLGAIAVLGEVTRDLLTHLEEAQPAVWRLLGAEGLEPLAAVLTDSGLLGSADGDPAGAASDAAAGCGTALLAVAPALRETLSADFAGQHPEATRALHSAASAYWEGTGEPADLARSVVHARRAGDWPHLTHLAARHGWWLGAHHPRATIAAYAGLTDDAVRTSPVLVLTRELAHALHPAAIDPDPRSPMVQRVFARSVQETAAGTTDPDVRVFLTIAHVNALRQRGAPAEALRVGDAQRPGLTPRWQDVSALNRSFYYLQTGLAAAEVGDVPRAMRRFARAYDESGGEQSQFVACSAAGHHALMLAYEGRRTAAVQWAERAEQGAAGQEWIGRIAGPPVRLARSYLALDESDAQAAAAIVEDEAALLSIFDMWPLLLDVHARAALAAGAPVRALDAIEHAVGTQSLRRPPSPLAQALVVRARAELLLADGQLTRASLLLERTQAQTVAGPPPLRQLLRVTEARLRLLAGQHQQARQLAARTLAEDPMRRLALDLLLIDAAAALALGETEDAARGIGRVVSMTPARELTALLRGVDTVTRGELAGLLGGVRAEVLAQADGALTAPPFHPAHGELVELTERERSVLGSLARGATLADIAQADVLSVNTVKKQAGSLYRKLGADSRAAALRTASDLGFLDETGGDED
jgi:LuxR family maltose regulon positive regulatory protein